MKIRFLGIMLCVIPLITAEGCSHSNEESKEIAKSEVSQKEDKATREMEKTPVEPQVDENCSKVYSKEECETFTEYYKSGEGQKETEVAKEKPAAKTDGKLAEKEVYEKVAEMLKKLGGESQKVFPAPYEKDAVQKRTDGLYYIHSTYELRGTPKGDGVYGFEMLMSDTFELKDAYIEGTYGRYSRPMKYDEINESYRKQAEQNTIEKAKETPEDRERKKQEDEKSKKEHEKVMNSIYGDAVNGVTVDENGVRK
ncbi:hypothetical protein COL36_10390 [Bacillus wiedmannii]|uniref:hypothetical protein n=1 Tax=Bacillus wiedmannii TaxID=1890302 RepID=UPI000BF355BE|nr:hypothetical protein [Bacillus wiedmannii]PFX61609.1 hypothetical protein COL36_10390 [Bacillus wiedmannii]